MANYAEALSMPDVGRVLRGINIPGPARRELRVIGIPAHDGGLVRIRVRQPAEWLPNGRTVFWFDAADGRLVEVRDSRSLPLATRAFNLVYPLHSSMADSSTKGAMTITGLALALLGTLAVFAFWSYRARSTYGSRLVEHANAR